MPNTDPIHLNLQNSSASLFTRLDEDKNTKLASLIRALAFIAIESARSGHPGGSSSKVEQLLAMLLSGLFAFDPLNPKNPSRDRLVWSAGHCTPLLYGTLALIYESLKRTGINFDKEKLNAILPECLLKFRHCDGLSGHVESIYPLADVSTGSSGHGLSAAAGIAALHRSCGLATKIWVLMGDAETEEGITYEARNILDYNHFGIDGNINEVISTPYINHWLGLGWNVIEVNGHNIAELLEAYKKAKEGFKNDHPTVVLCHGTKGLHYGKNENKSDSHGTPAKHGEYVEIMKAMRFDIPGVDKKAQDDLNFVLSSLDKDLAEYFLEKLKKGQELLPQEKHQVEKMKETLPGRPLTKPIAITRPAQLPPELVFAQGTEVTTRKATEAWFKWLMTQSAFFYLGAGDLMKSILTGAAENIYGIINKDNPLGRGFRFGIAEQNMAMLSATLTQDVLPGGFQAVSVFASYGVFTSIMANSVRMALINNAVNPTNKGFFIMLAAHDGPETGEDGPTHHGLFWMSLFNAYPGIKAYKPLDANETIEMLFYALNKGEPIALSIMRPNTLVFKRDDGIPPASEAVNGAYVFIKHADNGKKKIVLAVSGGQTMVNVLKILPELEKNYDVKILAVTSPELFEELRTANQKKAEAIFSNEERAHTIALHNGWPGFLYPFLLPAGYPARSIGVNKFLKSGPPTEVYEMAGLDPQGIKNKIINAIKYV
ncbi:MAG: hypothetical protein HZC05_01815 [Candidatus Magasanikbacteria bacterium]|nr:hypothetical protein [Candidatus Magasanikbacteria bacterium]